VRGFLDYLSLRLVMCLSRPIANLMAAETARAYRKGYLRALQDVKDGINERWKGMLK